MVDAEVNVKRMVSPSSGAMVLVVMGPDGQPRERIPVPDRLKDAARQDKMKVFKMLRK